MQLSSRYADGEGGPFAKLALAFDRAAVGLDDGLYDREAEAGVEGVVGSSGLIGAVEALEDVRKIFDRDPGTIIADGEAGVAVVTMSGDMDVPPARVVLNGVGEEVAGDGAERG